MKSPLCCSLVLAAAVSVLHADTGGPPVPLSQALESGALVWRTGGEAPWFGSALMSHDGADAARSGGAGSGESWLETDATGPGALAFWVKSETAGARVSLNDAALVETGSEWTRRTLRLGPGAQRVRFSAPYNTQSTSGADAMFLDEVNFAPSAAVSLGEAADAPGLTWAGSAGAFGFSENGDDFIVVQARAGTGGSVTAQLTGPAAVRFRWKMTGYGAEAKFTASVGTAAQEWRVPADPADTARGVEAWFDAEVLVPAGAQSVVWVPDAGGDFLLDAVTVTAAPSAGAAVGQPGLTWSGDWLTRPAAQALGGAVAVTRVVVPEQESVLTTIITGPAEVTYVSSLLSAQSNDPLAPIGAVPVRVDGAEGTMRTTALADGWQRTTIFVPEGAHTVAWAVANPPTPFWQSPQSLQGVLDDVQVTPVAPASLAEALKTTLSPQVTEGAALSGRWRGMKSLTSGLNGSAVVCGPLAEGEATTLTLPVTGPARLLFSVRGERYQWDRQVKLTAQLDGADVLPAEAVTGPPGATIPPLPPADWRTLLVSIPSGAHTLTLRAFEAATGTLLWLDAVGYLPADPGASKLAAAVEMPGTQWRRISPPGRGAWRVLAAPMAREGKTFAACMDVPAGQSASAETTLSGPGTLEFSWGQAVDGTLKVFVNDMEAAQAWSAFSSETPRGERVDLVLPPGPQTVRWTYTQARPPTPSPAAAQAWLDAVKFTPLAAGSPPGPGLDVTAPVTTDNDWPWHTAAPSFSATGDGDAAMVEVPQSGAAFLEMPLTGPGRFAFWWRAETEYLSRNAITLAVDDFATAWLPSANNWYRSEFTVGPGAHRLRWLVGPSGGSLRREDVRRVWLDGFTALPTLPLAAALENSLTWTTGAPSAEGDFTDWIGLPAAETAGNPGTDDAAVTLGTRPLTTQVTGPGVVTFRWAEKSVPPLPVVEAPPLPPAPGSPMVLGGGTLGLVMYGISLWEWNWWQPPPPRAVFAVNGTSRATLELSETGSDSDWATHTIHLGPGEHTLTWQRPARSDGRRLVVESVSFTPQPDLYAPAAAELGVPVAGLTMNGAPWIVQNAQTHDGTAALQSPAGGGSPLAMSFTGPGELSFWWKAEGSARFGESGVDTTGWNPFTAWAYQNSLLTVYAPEQWQRFALPVPAGRHEFYWSTNATATLWLDEVTFSTPQPLAGPNAVAEALDFSGLTWNAPGWQPMTGGGLGETRDALAGPEYGGAADPWLETNVTGPATLSFAWWREIFPPTEVSAPAGPVKFLLDGVETALTAGSGRVEAAVPAGSHTLRFIFQSTTAQHRRPVMDDVRLSVPVAAALDQPALTWTSDSATLPWRGWQSDRYAGHGTWVEVSVNAEGVPAGGTLSTVMTGPAMVSFEVLFPVPADTRGLGGASQETLLLSVDGVERWRASLTTEGWQTVTTFIGPGTHTVSWRTAAGFASKLDNCVITPDPAPQPTLAEAVETPGREFFGDPQYLPADWIPMRNAAGGAHDDAALAFYNSARPSSLGTTVEGPAWVTFDYRSVGLALKVITDDGPRYTLDPDYIYSGYPPPAPVWKSAPPVFIPAGSHQCLWQTGNRLAAAPVPWVQVDAITITPLYFAPGEVPLAEALEAPGLTFTSTGTGTAWTGRSVAGTTGGDAATVIATSANAELNTTVTGPGTLVWRWKVERFGTYWSGYPPSLGLLLNGNYKVSQGPITPADWITAEWPVPPGEHEVRWFLRSPYDNSIAWLDDVRFIAAPTFAEALDLPAAGVTVNVESGAPAPVTLRDGSDAVFLDAATGNGPVLSATVTGPGELAFDWKNSLPSDSHARMVTVDSQPAGDWYPPYAPGTYVFTTSRAFIAVGAGEHIIRWHANFSYGGDGAGLWLDRVTWSTGVPAWAQAAGGIGANGVSAWITGGVPPWSAAAGAGLNNSAAATASAGWLAAIVPPGPGTVCWWGRTESTGSFSTDARLTGPGAPAFLSSEWRFVRGSRTGGQPLPMWRTGTEAFVTGANFTPAVTVPLSVALDAPAVVFETSPAAPWAGVVVEDAPLGSAAARAGWPENNADSWLRASFTGPGRLDFSFRTRALRSDRNPRAVVEVDLSGWYLVSTPRGAWQAHSIWLEPGEHTVTWLLREVQEGDELWLDAVRYTPPQPVSLAAALEYTSAPWTTGGTGAWGGLSPIPETAGNGAALSPALLENEEAWLETTVPGSGVLTWRWRYGANGLPAGEFAFHLDDLPLTRLDLGTGWRSERWELPAGPHTLRWRYRAHQPGSGAALLDAVTFTPGPPPAWEAALGAPGVPIGGGGSLAWRMLTEDGHTFLRGPEDGQNVEPWTSATVFADITGPAFVDYSVRARFSVFMQLDDAAFSRYLPDDNWSTQRLLMPPGRHRLMWRAEFFRSTDLRTLRITPAPALSLAEAVEANGVTLFNDAAGSWFGVREPGLAGDDDYAALWVPLEEERTLEVECTGPGVLRGAWEWTPEDLSGTGDLRMMEGEAELARIFSGGGDRHTWNLVRQFGPGTHRLQFKVLASNGLVGLRLLSMQFERWPAAPVPLAVALEQPAWTFRTGGPVPWQGTATSAGVNGHLAFSTVSATAPDAPPSWIETDITGPGVLYHDFQTPAYTGLISVDGALYPWSGPVNLAPGPHTVRWAVQPVDPAANVLATLDDLQWLPATWSGWQAYHFPAGTPAAVSDFTADPDGDGRANGLEAWLGSSPLRTDTAPALTITPAVHPGPRLSLEYAAAPPEGLTLAIESAATLAGPWNAVLQRTPPGYWSGDHSYDTPPATARERIYFHAGGDAAHFYRVRVTRTP